MTIDWTPGEVSRCLVNSMTPRRVTVAEVTLRVPVIQTEAWGAHLAEYHVTGTAIVFNHDGIGLEDAFDRAKVQARILAHRIQRANPDHYQTPPRY